ncbi:malate:quinone oxidoreductase [Escherichia coli]
MGKLNYTPQNADGSISIEKAVAINEAFQTSRQFWAHQVERGVLRTPRSFINTVPHIALSGARITLISCAPVTPRCNKARCCGYAL